MQQEISLLPLHFMRLVLVPLLNAGFQSQLINLRMVASLQYGISGAGKGDAWLLGPKNLAVTIDKLPVLIVACVSGLAWGYLWAICQMVSNLQGAHVRSFASSSNNQYGLHLQVCISEWCTMVGVEWICVESITIQ